ncbi:MAG: DNA-directed DNA polymerase [Vezdaea aestivalis]|nr:MAG: DNA-directed DNA polymerase [Vezdaea aestivalis]
MSRQFFEELGSHKEKNRLHAAHGLITEILGDDESGQKLSYSLKRLIQGLASGRKSSRIGFSLALTELLSQLFSPVDTRLERAGLRFDWILDVLKSSTKPETGSSGQDVKDRYIGRLFGLEALLTASLQHKSFSSFEQEKLLTMLFELTQEKSWMQAQCLWTLFSSLSRCPEPLARSIISHTRTYGLEKTPGGVALYLKACEIFGHSILKGSHWRHDDPLDRSNFQILAKVMREVTMVDHDSNPSIPDRTDTGSWTSKLHFAWEIVLTTIDQRSASSASSDLFQIFWMTVVDESLFGDHASSERKLWGFRLIPYALGLNIAEKSVILSGPKFMRSLINHISSSDRSLHKSSQLTVSAILQMVTESRLHPIDFLSPILSSGPGPTFDAATNSKTLEKLLSAVDETNWKPVIEALQISICVPKIDETKAIELWRQRSADLLVTICRRLAKKGVEDGVAAIMDFVIQSGYSKNPSALRNVSLQPCLSTLSQAMFREKLFSILGHQCSSKAVQATSLPYIAVLQIHTISKNEDGLVIVTDRKLRNAQKRSIKTCKKVQKRIQKNGLASEPRLEASLLFLSTTILLLLNGDADSLSLLEELRDCLEDYFELGHFGALFNFVTEALLSLLSKPSVFLRGVAGVIFEAFAGDMNQDSMESIAKVIIYATAVLTAPENVKGQQAMFDEDMDVDSDDLMELDKDSGNGSFGSDVEVEQLDPGQNETPDSSSDSDVGPTDGEKNNEAEKALDLALSKVLGANLDENVKGDNADDLSDMDDDQMMELDNKIVNIFQESKASKSKRSENKMAKELIISFKMRVLDLVRIFFKTQSTNWLTLQLVQPLLELMRTTRHKDLGNRVAEILRQFSAQCTKEKTFPSIDNVEATWTILSAVHSEVTHDASTAHNSICSTMSLFLVKSLVALDRKHVDRAIDIYANTWKSWLLTKGCRIQPKFFSDFVNWSYSAAGRLQN